MNTRPPAAAAEPAPAFEVVHNEAARRFEARIEGHLALANYRLRGGSEHTVMEMFHTESPPALQGRGVAAALVKAALAHAQAQGWKVAPLCSYVAAYMQRHPETQSLRA